MQRLPLLALALLISLTTKLHAADTVTVGGAVLPIAKGWTQTPQDDGSVVLTPPNLPAGTNCTFTLLGGEVFSGSLKDRIASEWKEFETIGKIISDDGGTMTAGPNVVAGRSGQVQLKNGAIIWVWLNIANVNGRIERMLLVTTTPELFTLHAPTVSTMINGTQWIAPKPPPVAGPVAGPNTKGSFGHINYIIPVGWRETKSDAQVTLSPGDLRKDESLDIILFPSSNAAEKLPDALKRAWDEGAALSHLQSTLTVNHAPFNTLQEERTSFKGWPYTRAEGVLTAGPAKDFHANLTVIKINNRFERIFIRSKQNNQVSADQDPVYYAAIQEFLFSLQFDDWKDVKVQPGTLKGDGIVGAWAGISMFGGKLSADYALFYSNGQVFYASRFPLRGNLDFNTWIDSEMFPRYWGTYTFKDGKGSLKMIFGEIPIESKGNDLILTPNGAPHTYVRLPNVDGAKLAGTYIFPQRTGINPAITFTADGHFDDKGALLLLKLESSYPFSNVNTPGGGTYSVKDYTMLFNYTDGRKYRIAFPGLGYDPKQQSPASLPLGYTDQELTKQNP